MECPSKKSCMCKYGRYAIFPGSNSTYRDVDTSCPYIQFKCTNVGDFYVCKLGNTYVPGGPLNSPW